MSEKTHDLVKRLDECAQPSGGAVIGMNLADEIRAALVRLAQYEGANERLRGQLQNCVNHLHGARRTGRSDQIDNAIESANKVLYETNSVSSVSTDSVMECTFCQGPMSKNPHKEARLPGKILEVGAVFQCIPCTVKSRAGWFERAAAAEKRERTLAEVLEEVLDAPYVLEEASIPRSGDTTLPQVVGTLHIANVRREKWRCVLAAYRTSA